MFPEEHLIFTKSEYNAVCKQLNYFTPPPYEVYEAVVKKWVDGDIDSFEIDLSLYLKSLDSLDANELKGVCIELCINSLICRYGVGYVEDAGYDYYYDEPVEAFRDGVVYLEDVEKEKELRAHMIEENLSDDAVFGLLKPYIEDDALYVNKEKLIEKHSEVFFKYRFKESSEDIYIDTSHYTEGLDFNMGFEETFDTTISEAKRLCKKIALYEKIDQALPENDIQIKDPMALRDEKNLANNPAKAKSNKLKI
ncbi:TPA: hypothetical protein QDB06_000838 [Burkholderia vietnamiensis]|nr:hypothetical protein [Burkholderia vietnamiensis]